MTVDLNVDVRLTDEAIARARSRLGEVTHITGGWNTEASRDSIRHWAHGIGDDNPLWCDPEYGAKSRYGTIIAPPSFLTSVTMGTIAGGRGSGGFRGFAGVHRFWAGDAWEFFEPIRRNDELRAESRVESIIEHTSEMAGRSVEDIALKEFYNQHGRLVATQRQSFLNTERSTSRKRGKFKSFEEYVWTDEALAKLHADIAREERRGTEPRYFEDVRVDDEIPHVVKGPLSQCEMVAFHAGWGGPFLLASEIAQRYVQEHPKANVPDRANNAPDFPMRAHWDRALAREVGAPSAYDIGAQRFGWIVHALTNWCGDDGFVRAVEVKFTKFNLLGDATWCKGKVTGKEIVDGEPLAALDVWGENQRGEVTVAGKAKVRLPLRNA